MKNFNKTLLLMLGLAANIFLACSPENASSKEHYSPADTVKKPEYKNDSDTISGQTGSRNNALDPQGQ